MGFRQYSDLVCGWGRGFAGLGRWCGGGGGLLCVCVCTRGRTVVGGFEADWGGVGI